MPQQEREIYTVSQLNRLARSLLEDTFPTIWVEGEISNFSKPSSGHLYFSLKDVNAQIRCAMFKSKNNLLDFTPKDGTQVVVKGRISLYEPRGDFQLIIESMELSGDGALRRAFEQLKVKLAQEGLFNPEYKKPFPMIPSRIGVITSPTGAAIRDIIHVLHKRFPCIPIIIYPTAVQGSQAARQIVAAIELANARHECDVLILARGGGSLEDLWPFNEEIVARTIYASKLPIVSGVGHEVDFTIADFVADYRAPTPSAAAEFVSPDQTDIMKQLLHLEQRISSMLKKNIAYLAEHIQHLQKRLRDPRYYLRDLNQRIDLLEQALIHTIITHSNLLQKKLDNLSWRLKQYNPLIVLQSFFEKLGHLNARIHLAANASIENKSQILRNHMRALHAVSPLAILERGYSITTDTHQKIIHDINTIIIGSEIKTQLHHGILTSIVTQKT